MTGFETIIAILVTGLTFLVVVCAILICVSNMIDRKMRTKTELELKVFDKEMAEFGKIVNGACEVIGKYMEKNQKEKEERANRMMTSKQDGFGII